MAKSAPFEMQENPFQTLTGYNGGLIRLGESAICMIKKNIALAKRWNENFPKRCLGS